ncbi:hypothetical protein, partial [Brevundimonas sp.]|uniref:3'-5' exonuclease n=1 Tax=Brevundimonas sp. TaxID=1871086 RepID=UPI003783677D
PERAKEIKDQLLSSKVDQDSISAIIGELDRSELMRLMTDDLDVSGMRVPADMQQEVRDYLKEREAAKPALFEELSDLLKQVGRRNGWTDEETEAEISSYDGASYDRLTTAIDYYKAEGYVPRSSEPTAEPAAEPEPTAEPKPEAQPKPEFFDPATNFMTVEQNNNAYWEWAKESLKNGTMSPEDLGELISRLGNAIIDSRTAAEAKDSSGNDVRGNLLKSNVLNYLKENPNATREDLEEALYEGSLYNISLDKEFYAWQKLLGYDTWSIIRDAQQSQLNIIATQYYREAKQSQVKDSTVEPVVEEPAAEPTPEPTPEPAPAAEALPENTTPKKASEVKFGDRVFDNTTKSFATVVGIREAANRPNRTIITLRFDDGTERSAIYKNSVVFLVESKPESEKAPEKPAATQPDPTPVDQDPQDAAEQGDSVPAEPGSVVVDDTPEKPTPSKQAATKPKKFDLRGVPEEERAAVIELWDAVESFAKAVARVGNQTFISPERSISERDRQKYGVFPEDVSAEITKSIEEALGVRLVEPTTDAVDSKTGYTKRQPTPGAFTGMVARLVEGKTKKETRDIIKGLPVFWFDTETTGISSFDGDPTNNDAVQVGIVFTENGEVKRRLNIYLNPGIENGVRLGKWSAQNLMRDVLDKDGNPVLDADGKPKTELVTNEWLSKQMSISDAAAKIIEFMGPNPIIGGQNVPFDLQVLNRMLAVARRTDFSIAGTIDSKDLAEALLPKYNKKAGIDGPKKYDKERKDFIPTSSLGFVAEFLGFDLTRWHSADGDAEDSWKLTSSILDRAAAEDPDRTNNLMDERYMAQRYAERMQEFLAAIDPNNPSTAKQHGAVREDGFGEYLDALGLNPVAQVA